MSFWICFGKSTPLRNIDSFLLLIRQTLRDMYFQNWNSIIVSSSKCHYYKLFKSSLTAESYHFDINIRKYKLALIQFRCSGHKLMIEVGRQQHLPKDFVSNVNLTKLKMSIIFC